MRTGTPGHLKTFDYLGLHRYSLTFCTYQRRPLFITEAVVALVLSQISRAAVEAQFAVVAYCFMPDHVHLLIEGLAVSCDCRRFIVRAKQYSGFQFSRLHGDRLWQRYAFEHVLRDDELAMVVAKYILENPIRAGLVRRVDDYPFVGSGVYSLADLMDGIARECGTG
jgi:putative transposase